MVETDRSEDGTEQADECPVEVIPQDYGVLIVREFEEGGRPDTFWISEDHIDEVVKELHEASYDVNGADA